MIPHFHLFVWLFSAWTGLPLGHTDQVYDAKTDLVACQVEAHRVELVMNRSGHRRSRVIVRCLPFS